MPRCPHACPILSLTLKCCCFGITWWGDRLFFFGVNLTSREERRRSSTHSSGMYLEKVSGQNSRFQNPKQIDTILFPNQLGYGIKGGAEAAIHSTRQYLSALSPNSALIKLDFQNTFNSIRRDKPSMQSWIQLLTLLPLSIQHILLPPYLFGVQTKSSNQRKGSNRVIPWVPCCFAQQSTAC